MTAITHNLIADTAKAIALEAYESLAHSNDFYAAWPNRDSFVAQNFSMFIPEARIALLKILGSPDYPEAMKEPIYQALLIDGQLKHDHDAPRQQTRFEKQLKRSGGSLILN